MLSLRVNHFNNDRMILPIVHQVDAIIALHDAIYGNFSHRAAAGGKSNVIECFPITVMNAEFTPVGR